MSGHHDSPAPQISPITDAIDEIRRGRMIILVDDEDRENEGDLVVAAEKVTPAAIDFMAREARGLICLALDPDRVDRLQLAPVTEHNRAPLGTAFLQSIDAAGLGRPGISAQDRAHTIQRSVAAQAGPGDFVSPGFTFPLRARKGGVLVRSGQTEGSVDLARLAGLRPAAVICEIMSADGTMSRLPELLEFGARHRIPVVTVADLIEYRLQKETFVHASARAQLPTEFGPFEIIAFESELDQATHIVLQHGKIDPNEPVLLRVHRAELLPDVFGIGGPKSRQKLDAALERIVAEGSGVMLYLRGEAMNDDLLGPLARGRSHSAPAVASPAVASPAVSSLADSQASSRKGSSMDFREFGIGAQILSSLGIRKLRVLTNRPMPFKGLKGFGLEIVEWLPLDEPAPPTEGA